MRKLVYAGLILSFSCLLIAAGCQVTQPTPQTVPLSTVVSNAESATYATVFGNSLMFVNNKMINIAKSPASVSSAVRKGVKAADGAPIWVKTTSHEVTAGYAYDTYAWYIKDLDQWGNTKVLIAYGSVSVYPTSGSSSASVAGKKVTAKASPFTTTTRVTTTRNTTTSTSTWNFNPNTATIVLHFGDPACFDANGLPKDPTTLSPTPPFWADLNSLDFDKTKFFFYEATWSGTLSIDKISLSTTAIMTIKIGTDTYTVSSTNAKIDSLLSDTPTADWPVKITKTDKQGNVSDVADGSLVYDIDGNWYLVLFNHRIYVPIVPVVKWFFSSDGTTTTTTTMSGSWGYIDGVVRQDTSDPNKIWSTFLNGADGTLFVIVYTSPFFPGLDPSLNSIYGFSTPVSSTQPDAAYHIDLSGAVPSPSQVMVYAFLYPIQGLTPPLPSAGYLFGQYMGAIDLNAATQWIGVDIYLNNQQ